MIPSETEAMARHSQYHDTKTDHHRRLSQLTRRLDAFPDCLMIGNRSASDPLSDT